MVVVAVAIPFHELLNAPPADGLADVEVALRIDRHHVQERELSGHVPGPAETRQDVAGRVIEDPITSLRHRVVQNFRPIRREINVPR